MPTIIQNAHREQPRRQRAILRQGQQRRPSGGLSPQFLSLALSLILGTLLIRRSDSFGFIPLATSTSSLTRSKVATSGSVLTASPSGDNLESSVHTRATETRRGILSRATNTASAWCLLTASLATRPLPASAAPEDDVKEMRALIETAKAQLDTVVPLIKDEKWDGVRAVLMEAPLRDCWSKSTPILKKYADALGETPKGDELAALEGREELLQRLRFLDMAVYNNVFNPIASEGKTGASKALIDSYYNDPTREFEGSKAAIEGLLQLSSSN